MSRDPLVRSDRPVGYDPLTQQNLSAATVFMRLGATSLARLHGCVRLVYCQAKLLSLPSCLYYFLSLLVSFSFSHSGKASGRCCRAMLARHQGMNFIITTSFLQMLRDTHIHYLDNCTNRS